MASRPLEREGLASPFDRLLVIWLATAAVLSPAVLYSLTVRPRTNTETFLLTQDLPVLALYALAMIPLGLVGARALGPLDRARAWPAGRQLALMAGLCLVAGAFGPWLLFGGYTLSLDEFLANFDAAIFAHGQLMAPVSPQWRPFVSALQPMYMLPSADNVWASSYLPVNAGLRALASKVGLESLVNPLLSAFSVVATYAVGRRLWPERPGIALGAAALLATSSQLIVMSATAYAMPAHLAFNLAWLWLFLRGGRLGHAGAIAVGFLASGLHQVLFHPLFVAPFILQLWLDRRWRLGGVYTLAYAAIGLFWVEYWQLEMRLLGAAPEDAQSVGGGWFLDRVVEVLAQFRLEAFGAMGQSLMRFVTWQNPLTAPLAIGGAVAAVLAKGHTRAMAAGVVLTLLAVLISVPSQTHGWGYRYLHGLLGSICLLAAWTWARWTDGLPAERGKAAANGFALACAFSLVLVTPLRAWQAWRYVRPYALANAQIQSAPADVVIVDHIDNPGFDAGTVVRNDPYLQHGPKVMQLSYMDETMVRDVCAHHRILVFDGRNAAADGIDIVRFSRPPGIARLRTLMDSLGCGGRIPPNTVIPERRMGALSGISLHNSARMPRANITFDTRLR